MRTPLPRRASPRYTRRLPSPWSGWPLASSATSAIFAGMGSPTSSTMRYWTEPGATTTGSTTVVCPAVTWMVCGTESPMPSCVRATTTYAPVGRVAWKLPSRTSGTPTSASAASTSP